MTDKKYTLSFLLLSLLILLNNSFVFAQERDINKLVPYLKGNKWGLLYPDGLEFYPPVFDSIVLQNLYSMYSVFKRDEGKEVQRALVKKKGIWFFLSEQKKLLPLDRMSQNKLFHPKAQINRKNNFKVISQPNIPGEISEDRLWQLLGTKRTNTLIIAKNGNSFEIIDSSSKISFHKEGLYMPELDADKFYASRDSDEKYRYVIIERKGKQALVDANTLQITIPFDYSYINDYHLEDDWKIVKKNNSWGVVDSKNKEIIPIKFQLVLVNYYSRQNDSLPIIVKFFDKFFFIRYQNFEPIESETKYGFLSFFKFNLNSKPSIPLYLASNGGKKGLVNHNDEVVIPMQYDSIFATSNTDLVLLNCSKKMGFYNLSTGFIKEPVYDEILELYRVGNIYKGSDFYIMRVRRNNKTFFIDLNGNEFLYR
jgi:hypothetical protein